MLLEVCTGCPFSEYLQDMTTCGTYGDELTLLAVPYIFNVELTIVSTLLKDGRLLIAPINSVARARLTLRNFVEGQGFHYWYWNEIKIILKTL